MDKLAVQETGITQIAIGGGVSANSGIRNTLKETEKKIRLENLYSEI
jgi:N6-L-threonylcarbamoyladenine synthase